MIRGHHEDLSINVTSGLGEECEKKLGENIRQNNSIFMKLNSLFELLPFGVLIDNQILCVHGGIGSTINKLSDIENIKRPVQIVQDVRKPEQQIILDLLWSEYTEDTADISINEERDLTKAGFILKFGKDRLNKFLNDNKLSLLVTSHQWVSEGVKSFNNDKLLIVYSCTDYMDKFSNLGGMIHIAKKPANKPSQIIPKLIDVCKTDMKNYKQIKNISPLRWKYTK